MRIHSRRHPPGTEASGWSQSSDPSNGDPLPKSDPEWLSITLAGFLAALLVLAAVIVIAIL